MKVREEKRIRKGNNLPLIEVEEEFSSLGTTFRLVVYMRRGRPGESKKKGMIENVSTMLAEGKYQTTYG